ncbi:MAG: hypothetical protein KTR22_06185 [Flavobacteriaceae bacterium]|nr:hypothetical protein [Flavobacteriaceae bacterium]
MSLIATFAVKMIKNKHLIQLCIAPIMVLLVLLPTLASGLHDHSEAEEEHLHCSETTAHIHEGHFDCSLCFVIITPTVHSPEHETVNTKTILITGQPENHSDTNFISYELGYKFRRGPPSVS